MEKLVLSRTAVDSAAEPIWALVEPVFHFLAGRRYEQLSPRQRAAQLALFYSNEINNGGHLQYFHNQGVERADELVAALDAMGAGRQREIFVEALGRAHANPVERAESLEAYSERAYEAEYRDLDDAFYACRPELGNELLPDYIAAHVDDFVEWE